MMKLNEQCRILITNDEKVLYMGSLHFLYGFRWLLLTFATFGVATAILANAWVNTADVTRPIILIPSALLFVTGCATWLTYAMPFWRSFFVITDQRALIGIGQFTIVQEQILPHQLEDWELRENYFETMLGFGHLTLRLLEGRQLRIINIPYLRQPHLFTRFLDEISPIKSRPQEDNFGNLSKEPQPEPPTPEKQPQPKAPPEKPKQVPSNFSASIRAQRPAPNRS